MKEQVFLLRDLVKQNQIMNSSKPSEKLKFNFPSIYTIIRYICYVLSMSVEDGENNKYGITNALNESNAGQSRDPFAPYHDFRRRLRAEVAIQRSKNYDEDVDPRTYQEKMLRRGGALLAERVGA